MLSLYTLKEFKKSENLKIGQVLKFIGYGDSDLVITNIFPSNFGPIYETVNLETFIISKHDSLIAPIEEKKDDRICIYSTNEILIPEEVEKIKGKKI